MWRSIDLSHAAGSKRWSGGGLFSGSAAEWFIQAVDQNGNVGVISNKASIDPVTLPAPTGGISATVAVVPPGTVVNGWFKGDATVTISGAPDITSSLDGAPFAANDVVTVSGTGLHTVEYQGSNGAQGTSVVPIDITPPTIATSLGTVEMGETLSPAFYPCSDAGSGIASCVASGINTSTPTLNGATRTYTVTATDRVGLTTTATGTYRVTYAFRGFDGLDDPPALNNVKAGHDVLISFKLGGNQGLNVFAAGSPQTGRIPCGFEGPVTDLQAATTTKLVYKPGVDRYQFEWRTKTNWKDTCRVLIVRFVDGTEHRVNFRFR